MDLIGNVVVGAGISGVVYLSGLQRFSHLLYPVVFLYHIVTFTLAYPEAGLFRRLAMCFLLSFADLGVTISIFGLGVPERIWVWVLEFLVTFYLVYHLSFQELKQYLSHDFTRLLIYSSSGYMKSVSLVSTLVLFSSDHKIAHVKHFLLLVLIGSAKMVSTILVYYLDRVLSRGRFDQSTKEDIWKRLNFMAIAVFIAIEACAYYNEEINKEKVDYRDVCINDAMFEKRFNEIHLISGAYLAGLYAFYSFHYGLVLRERLDD